MIPLKKSLMLALGLVVLAAAVILTTTATVGASVQGLPFGGGLFFSQGCQHFSAATAGRAARHAAVARSVARHDGAAVVAAGGVAHLDDRRERIGSVDR